MTAKVWVVDDDRSMRWVLERALSQEGWGVRVFEDARTLLTQLQHEEPDTLITDMRMPGLDGLGLLARLQVSHPQLPVIVMTAHSDLDSAVSSFQGGAFEYLPKPFDVDEAVTLVRRAVQHRREMAVVAHAGGDAAETPEIIGESPAMQEVFRAIGRLSGSHITVLINGESGTGKERVAQALHRHSPRRAQPFIALNMAAIPRDLMESELFGHEKGSFSGATAQRNGRFEQAHGGTLFLDEIGDMPLETQTRLLRVLADGEFYRVGGTTPIRVDVRIIAATHQHLEKLVADGRFREDLFHRLNVIRVHIPRLSQRRSDIPMLADYFLRRAARELQVEVKVLRPETSEVLQSLPWPGNVRQLENTCRWLTVMAAGREILVEDLPHELLNLEERGAVVAVPDWEQALALWMRQCLARDERSLLTQVQSRFEKTLILEALAHTGGRRGEAAELLGWGRNTLTRKLKELGMAAGDDEST